MQPRDSQRQKLYRAEKVLWDRSKKFETVPEIEAYLKDTVLKDAWFKKEFPWVHSVKVHDGRARRRACGNSDRYRQPYMKLPKWSRKEAVVLHELAHGLQPKSTAWHGPEFCSIFSRLVYRFMGDVAFNDFTRSMRENNVRYLWIRRENHGPGKTQQEDVVFAQA